LSSNSAFERPALDAHAAASRERFESLLQRFVEVPSVSNDPAHKDDVHRMAELGANTLIDFGFEARVLPTKGHPIVHAFRVVDPNAPTVTLYNHLDVQPGGEPSDWKTQPFAFTRDGERWYARGTTDDKGPALTALFGARYALDHGAKVNVSLIWELEEEIGSPSFEAAIRSQAGALRTDVVCVSDTIWISRARPACPAGLRGLQGFLLRLETGATDQHSGTTGGAARNPLAELMGVVCACFDPKTGRVKIPGFYSDVVPPTREELDGFRKSGFSVPAFRKDHKLKSLRVNDPLEVMKRIWAMPTFEIHGVTGGYTGPQIKTIVPPRGEVKCSVRLVPKQDPKKVLRQIERFVKRVNKDVEVVPAGSLAPYRGVTTGPWAEAVKEAMAFAFGRPPVFVREGGSIGAVLTMEKVLRCPIVFLGLSLPEHGYHAPNENYDWRQASGGMTAFAKFFEHAASMRAQ
jgi:acetylornithine deacetylase/succinyl-diaminopimelate desuccinylase-like protein